MSFLTDSDEDTFEDFEAEFDEEDFGNNDEEGMFRGGGGIRARSDLAPTFTSTGGGVSQAFISTPQGQARVQLSRSVVGQRNFENVANALRTGINRNTTRLNELQRDVSSFSNRVAASTTRNSRQVRKLRTDTAKWQKANNTALARVRKEQQNSTMMFLLVTLLNDDGGISNNDNLLLLLVLMMNGGGFGGGGEGGGYGDNNMMMLLLVLILTGNLGGGHGHAQIATRSTAK
jgi:hypothetical protein